MMKNKTIIAVLMSLLCISAPLTGTAFPGQMIISASAEEYLFQTNCSYIYNSLSADQKSVYDQLLQSCREVDESSGIYETIPAVTSRKLSSAEMINLSSIFVFDHPEFFWISPNYEISASGRSVTYTMKLYSQYQDGTARQETKQQLIALEQEYLNQAAAYDSDYEKAEYFLKALREDITFGYGEDHIDQSIASALLDKKTVCAGFSKLYELLCNASGIDVMTEISLNHAWNVIFLDEHWYHVDVTYDLFLYSDSELHEYDLTRGLYTTEIDGEEISFYMHEPYQAFYSFALPDTSQSYEKPLSAGDANADGSINILDVITMNRAVLGKESLTEAQLRAVDFNQNGKPDSEESLAMLKYIVGLIDSLTAVSENK